MSKIADSPVCPQCDADLEYPEAESLRVVEVQCEECGATVQITEFLSYETEVVNAR